MSIRSNWKILQDDIAESAERYGRNVGDISVMAVTKTRTVQEVQQAIETGLKIFGENRTEEGAKKFADLNPDTYTLCFIGHLQSKKVKQIDQSFSGVHSVDTLKLARKLSAMRKKIDSPLDVLIQVNCSGEDTKSGFRDEKELRDAAAEISEMPFLSLKGIMTMAPFVDDEKIVRNCFSKCREWAWGIRSCIPQKAVLSMGMSSDYSWAIAEGSTLLRIGRAMFRCRP